MSRKRKINSKVPVLESPNTRSKKRLILEEEIPNFITGGAGSSLQHREPLSTVAVEESSFGSPALVVTSIDSMLPVNEPYLMTPDLRSSDPPTTAPSDPPTTAPSDPPTTSSDSPTTAPSDPPTTSSDPPTTAPSYPPTTSSDPPTTDPPTDVHESADPRDPLILPNIDRSPATDVSADPFDSVVLSNNDHDRIIDLRKLKQLPVFFRGFSTIQIPFFVRTKQFNNLLQQLNTCSSSSTTKRFILVGPSGTGKSVSLIALFRYYLSDVTQKFLPFLMTDDSISTVSMKDMQRRLLSYFGAEFSNLQCYETWYDFVKEVEVAFPNKKLLLLYDVTKSNVEFNSRLFDLFNSFSSVIALTSRESKFSENSMDIVESLRRYFSSKEIRYELFKKEEVQCIVSLLKVNVDLEKLERQTLFSPILVMVHLLNEDLKKKALSKLQAKFELRLSEWSSFMFSSHREVMSSIYFLRKMGQQITKQDEIDAFPNCYLATYNLIFLDEFNFVKTSCIHVYSKLMDILSRVKLNLTVISQLDIRFANAVKGERLERLFYHNVSALQLTVYGLGTSLSDVSIKVAGRSIKERGEVVDAVNNETLYMLEPGHPSIDFVLASEDTLFMIQISTQTYSAHGTKSRSVALAYRKKTVLRHYRALRSNVVYVYLTTAENPTVENLRSGSKCAVGVSKKGSQLSYYLMSLRETLQRQFSDLRESN